MTLKKSFGAVLVALSAAGNVAASEAPSFVEFVRPLGMGGAFTALSDDKNAFSYNPAGIVQRTGPEVTILEVVGGGSEDAKKALDFLDDNHDKLTNFDTQPAQEQARIANEINDSIAKLNPHVYVGADIASFISGPGWKGIHAGFGLLGVADARFKLYNGGTAPLIDYSINNDFLIPLMFAKRWESPFSIPGKLGFGVTGKYIQRNTIQESRLSVVALEDFNAPPLTQGKGVGMDVGSLYQPTDRWNVGFMVRDFLGTKMKFEDRAAEDGFPAVASRESVIRPQVNFGVATIPRTFFGLGRTSDRLTLAADVRDMFQEDDHVFFQDGFKKVLGEDLPTHLHLGAEYRYWFLRFRGGAYQGYPTLGLGIDIPVLKIDYAYFSRELGARAGDEREINHTISVALRFGSGNTEARERIVKAKEAQKGEVTDAPIESASDEAPAKETKKEEKSETPAKKK